MDKKTTALAASLFGAGFVGGKVSEHIGPAYAQTHEVRMVGQVQQSSPLCAAIDAVGNVPGQRPSRVTFYRLDDAAVCYQVEVVTELQGTFKPEE